MLGQPVDALEGVVVVVALEGVVVVALEVVVVVAASEAVDNVAAAAAAGSTEEADDRTSDVPFPVVGLVAAHLLPSGYHWFAHAFAPYCHYSSLVVSVVAASEPYLNLNPVYYPTASALPPIVVAVHPPATVQSGSASTHSVEWTFPKHFSVAC